MLATTTKPRRKLSMKISMGKDRMFGVLSITNNNKRDKKKKEIKYTRSWSSGLSTCSEDSPIVRKKNSLNVNNDIATLNRIQFKKETVKVIPASKRAEEVFKYFSKAKPSDLRTIKVDITPSKANSKDVLNALKMVARSCGYNTAHILNENKILLLEQNRLSHQPFNNNCNSRNHLSVYEFPVVQELKIRDYGSSSAKYAVLHLSWLPKHPRKYRKNFTSSICIPSVEQIVEEIIGRWRAVLYQYEYALETATLDNNAQSPWENLVEDEVDYESSSEEDDDIKETINAELKGESKLPTPPSLFPTQNKREDIKLKKRLSCASSFDEKSNVFRENMVRPKSVLKMPGDINGVSYELKSKRSVNFASTGVQVHRLEVSRPHREARMSEGCKAIDRFGKNRPFTSTRTGDFILLDDAESLNTIKSSVYSSSKSFKSSLKINSSSRKNENKSSGKENYNEQYLNTVVDIGPNFIVDYTNDEKNGTSPIKKNHSGAAISA